MRTNLAWRLRRYALIFILRALFIDSYPAPLLSQQQVLPAGTQNDKRGPQMEASSTGVTPSREARNLVEISAIDNGGESAPIAPPPVVVRPVQSTVEVNATGEISEPYRVTKEEVLSSAGTWGDFSRYLQLMPGVVWNTDLSNDIMVRGGNPTENLFVVDGIEVPNINHIAVEGTTGGFTSMIDTTAIRSVELKSGVYDPGFSSRLSSLVEIHTRDARPGTRGGELDFGISGAGGMILEPLGSGGDVQFFAHRSILNLATDDIGINGVPIYTNGMAKAEWARGSRDHFRALSLSGKDSIGIKPGLCQAGVTTDVQTQYKGWRSTNGLVWQHTHNPRSLSTITLSYSAQNQDIEQQELSPVYSSNKCKEPPPLRSVYSEHTSDRSAILKYGLSMSWNKWTYSVGATGQLVRLDYAVDQPLGQQSPFNSDPIFTDAVSFARDPTVGQTATYLEAAGPVSSRVLATVGMREERATLTGANVLEPQASLAVRLNERQSITMTYGHSAQLPPWIDSLSFPGNLHLRPIQVEQYSLGANLWRTDWLMLSAEAYHKRYFDEPVSTEYPSLMLANMVDTLGQQFVWLPLKTGGWGRASGLELLLRTHFANRLQLLASATYSRTRYAAGDGALRPGNYDFPLVANGMATIRIPWKLQIAVRNSYSTGRPFTPFDIALSEQQARGIYDLSQINALRGPAYNRLDADMNRDFHILSGVLNIHGGVENTMDRRNFLGYAWLTNCTVALVMSSPLHCDNSVFGIPETRVNQMPRFPSAGFRYSF